MRKADHKEIQTPSSSERTVDEESEKTYTDDPSSFTDFILQYVSFLQFW
jgi:hypothetical protein